MKTRFLVLATSFVNSCSQEQNSSEIKRNSQDNEKNEKNGKNEKKRRFSVGKDSPLIEKIAEGEKCGIFTNRMHSVRELAFPDLNMITPNGKIFFAKNSFSALFFLRKNPVFCEF